MDGNNSIKNRNMTNQIKALLIKKKDALIQNKESEAIRIQKEIENLERQEIIKKRDLLTNKNLKQ